MVPHFTGRQKECEEITGYVNSGSTRIVSIWGSPGFGKTSVAIAVGHQLQSQGLPVYFLSLRGLQSKADLASKLLSLFRRPVESYQQNQQRLSIDDELCYLLSGLSGHLTIILDNADDLLSGGPKMKEDFTHFLADILRRNEKVTFVITARESLEYLNVQFEGHQAVRINPLDEPSSQNLVNKLLPKTTAIPCERITQICGHVPLAMKLLCSFLSEEDFMSSLDNQNIVEMLDNPDYPTNLRLKLLFDSSFQRLSAEEKEAFVSLCVLPESFDLTIAAAVLGISQTSLAKRMLHNLRRKSLLESSTKSGSFSMHPLIRSFATEMGEKEMIESLLKSKARLRAFYLRRFKKLNEQFLAGHSMSALINFYQDEQSIKQSLIEGSSDPNTANSVFEVLVKAELFLCSLYFREESNFNTIYDSALKMAKMLNESVSHGQLLVSKALYQVTWGVRGKTTELLSKARNIEASCSPASAADKGKHLCYSGISQLVNGQTEAGVQSLEEAISLMSGTPEQTILRIIAFQILATYYEMKNNSERMLHFYNKSLQDCKTTGNTELLIIPTMKSAGTKIHEKEMKQQPLNFEIICILGEVAKHLNNTDTMRSISDAAQQIAKDIGESFAQSSLGLFIFKCNVSVTLPHVLNTVEGAANVSKGRSTSCHEMALNPCRTTSCPVRERLQTKELITIPRNASLPCRPILHSFAKSDIRENDSRTANRYPQYTQKNSSSALQLKQRSPDIRRKLGEENLADKADNYHLLGEKLHNQGDFSSALNYKNRALDIRRNLVGEEHSSTADSYYSLGDTQYALGDFSSSFQSAQLSLVIRCRLFGEEHSSTADSYHSLGATQHKLGDFSSAFQSAKRTLDIRLKLFGEEHPSTADSYHFLGDTQHQLGDFSSAVQSKKRALGIRRKLFGEEQSSTADSYHSLGATQYALGDFSSALQSAQLSLVIRRKLFGEKHSSTGESYHSLGATQHKLGDFSSALQSAQHALDIRLTLFGEEHCATADSYHSLGDTQHQLGDFASALQSAERALGIRRKLFGEEHSSTAESYHSLGATQYAQGDFSSAFQSTQRALGIRRTLFGEKHPSTAESYHSLGATQHKLGDFSSALQSAQRALDIRLTLFGAEHLSTADSYYLLRMTQIAQGNFSPALHSSLRLLSIREHNIN